METVSIERKGNRFVQNLLGPEDLMLIESIRAYVDEKIMPVRREIDVSARGDFAMVKEIQKSALPLGIQGGFLPEEYGGMGMDSAVTLSLLAEEMGRGEPSLFTLFASGILALRPAVVSENRAVLDYFAPRFIKEDELFLGAFAVSERASGCDAENVDMGSRGVATHAVLEGENWVINGDKTWVTNAGIASVYCVLCSTDHSSGDNGLALIYVEAPTEGLEVGEPKRKAGFLASRESDLRLKDVSTPKLWRASGPGTDAELFRENITLSRIISGALAIGVAQGAFDEVLSFTSDRIAAGKPIRQHSVAAHILADIATGIQVGRDAYVNAAYLFDHPETYGQRSSMHMLSRSSMVKIFCTDAAVMATNRAMELMGSYGYVTDYYVEKYWRDAKAIQLWGGGSQLAKLDVARGYYDYKQFHHNELYAKIRELSGKPR